MASHESAKKRAGGGSFFFENPLNVREFMIHFATERTRTPHTVQEHMQRCFEFISLVKGTALCIVDGKEHPLMPGSLAVLHPGQMHEVSFPEQDGLRYFALGVSAAESGEGHALESALVSLQSLDSPICKSDNEIYPLIGQALWEIKAKKPFYLDTLRSIVAQVVIQSYRAFYSGEDRADTSQSSPSQDVVFWIINHINANLFDIKNTTELSEAIGYSYSYLSHAFTQIMGMSIRDYIMRCKIETAKELLSSSNLSITQIAETLKYQTIHSFSKSFKKVAGMSPMEYVRENKLREGQ